MRCLIFGHSFAECPREDGDDDLRFFICSKCGTKAVVQFRPGHVRPLIVKPRSIS